MARLDLDMTEGNIWMHMLRFSIPMAIGLLFQQLYNTVDTLVVGQFVGQQAQAAVGSTGPIINTIVGFCAGLAYSKGFPQAMQNLKEPSMGLPQCGQSMGSVAPSTVASAMGVSAAASTVAEDSSITPVASRSANSATWSAGTSVASSWPSMSVSIVKVKDAPASALS